MKWLAKRIIQSRRGRMWAVECLYWMHRHKRPIMAPIK